MVKAGDDMKTAIIGAGACGILLASLLDDNKYDYTLFNKGKIGNKILASGNGRCNISNLNYDGNKYHDNKLALRVLSENKDDFFNLLNVYKIYTKADSEGRMYPISESSLSVLNVMLKHISKKIVEAEILTIDRKNDGYYLNNSYGPYDNVVIATGSNASYKSGYNYLNIIKKLKFNEFKPSLVGFQTNLKLKEISGSRSKCMAYLYNDNKLIYSEEGEVIYKDNGISGICIMNLSSYYAKLKKINNPYVKLDLAYNCEYDCYETVLQPKLYNYVLKNKINPHSFIIPIVKTYDFLFAQVCSGGIDISEINDNLSLKKYPNIYVGGEIIDVDGVCGGFNLMFAFSCAIKIFKELVK